MVFHTKGQGATEYLVLLAVVLIIALVSIALLGFFPGLAADAKITQSNTYWRGEARPVSIVEHSFGNTTNSMVLLNNDASGTIQITGITLKLSSDKSVAGSYNSTAFYLASGSQTTVNMSIVSPGAAGSTYEYDVEITYKTPNNLDATQYGMKPIVGKFN